MRGALLTAILVIIMVLSGTAILNIENKTTRKNELDANLSSAMERTLEILAIDKNYDIVANKDLIADCVQNFLVRLTANSNVEIEVVGADTQKGLLSIRATETFSAVFKVGKVSATRTVILDDYQNTDDEYFEVNFYNGIEEGVCKEPVKQLNVYGGSTLSNVDPVEMVKDGHTFLGWQLALKDEDGKYQVVDGLYDDFENITVTSDICFVSSWKEDEADIYTVSFYANNSVHAVEKVKLNGTIKSKIEDPEKAEKTFKGWSSNITDKLLSGEEVAALKIKKHTKFVAVFE